MSTQKRKQKSLHDLLSYMQMLEDGISFSHIHKNYGINEARLKVLWSRYQKEGISGLQKQPNSGKRTAKDKEVHREVESKGSRRQTSDLTNRNLILRLMNVDEFAIQIKVR